MRRPYPWKCRNCRERRVNPVMVDYTTQREHDGRVYEITVRGLEVLQCESCNARILPDESYRRLDEELRRQAGLLGPLEISRKRRTLGLNQKEFAQLLGVAPETVSRWETGGQIQQRVMNDFMQAVFDVPALQAYLRRKRGMSLPAAPSEQTSEPVQGNRIAIPAPADPHPREAALNTNVNTGPVGFVMVRG